MKENKKSDDIAWIIIEVLIIVIGIVMLVFGIKGIINENAATKDYIEIKATFIGTDMYDVEGKTHTLEYKYIVDGETYYISTDYYTAIIPKDGSIKTIKYNPEDPSDAVIEGFGEESIIILLGFMFVGIPLIILTSSSNKKDKSSKGVKKFESLITMILISLVIFGVGFGFCYIMFLGTDGFSVWETFKSSGGLVLLPMIFMLAGICTFFYSLFGKRTKEVVVKVDSIKQNEDGTLNVILKDENISDDSMGLLLYKYYIYNAENKDKFVVDKKFKVNIYKYGIALSYVDISEMIQARNLKQFTDEDFEEQLY